MILDELQAREDYYRAEAEACQRFLAERGAEQARLHALDPRQPLYLPPEDDVVPCEAFTAAWR
jgi:hypothetical protein